MVLFELGVSQPRVAITPKSGLSVVAKGNSISPRFLQLNELGEIAAKTSYEKETKHTNSNHDFMNS